MKKKKIIEELQDEICDLENKVLYLEKTNKILNEEIKKLEKKEKTNELKVLKKYRIAILVQGMNTKVLSYGNYEDNIKEVRFEHIASCLPELEITK